jgi:dimethylaniline monooxygenase (N-oxide forming)
MRMGRPPDDDVYYEFFKAKHTTQYLEEYVDRHRFAGQSLRQRIRFGFKVQKVRKLEGTWIVAGECNEKMCTFRAPKLIIACGITSTPNMPNLPGKERFEAPVVHQEAFGESSVLSSTAIKHITVLGGGKSAADMVYASVKAGKSVSWIIRASGTGPPFMVSPKGKGPYKNAFEVGGIRAACTMTPSILNSENWWTRFLHGTGWGRSVVNALWSGADGENCRIADYDGRKGALEGFEKLKPLTP